MDAAPAATHGAREQAVAPCPQLDGTPVSERPGVVQYSTAGYLGRTVRLGREGEADEHCVVVAWPSGENNHDGKPSRVARRLDEAWFRLIENTLRRIPWSHVKTLHRVVIDNTPTLHGLAAFNRRDPTDGRDGHTLWLNEHLFVDEDHWVRANVGSYFSYHTDRPRTTVDGLPADHERFSPVLLHEIGHLVMYALVNPQDDENSTPPCARSCGDHPAGCRGLPKKEQEAGCISPYCRPFGFPGSTENWAEQYRLFYQSNETRRLLSNANAKCLAVLIEHDDWPKDARGRWPYGLPDGEVEFQASRWDSCGGHACKGY